MCIRDSLGLDAALAGADLVVTGEGRFDATSLLGKAVGEVTDRAHRAAVPVRIVAGDSTDHRALTLLSLSGDSDDAQRRATHWLKLAGTWLARSAGRPTH